MTRPGRHDEGAEFDPARLTPGERQQCDRVGAKDVAHPRRIETISFRLPYPNDDLVECALGAHDRTQSYPDTHLDTSVMQGLPPFDPRSRAGSGIVQAEHVRFIIIGKNLRVAAKLDDRTQGLLRGTR